MSQKVLFLVGPTACGKSAVALELARRLDAEIVSADSMLVYRFMDIGTAKPTPEERRQIPHHMIDLVDPDQLFSVFAYRRQALACLRDIAGRGKLPIVCGGTGLYVRALREGLSGKPGRDESIRSKWEERVRDHGLEAVYAELCRRDAAAGERIKPQDKKRIIRALEVREMTQGISGVHESEIPLEALGFEPLVAGLCRDRALLYRDIERRVDRMFENGLVDEVRSLAGRGLSQTARQAVGYKELLSLLLQQPCPSPQQIERARDEIKKGSRHLAKRQFTWFRRERGIVWIDCTEDETIRSIAGRVEQVLSRSARTGRDAC